VILSATVPPVEIMSSTIRHVRPDTYTVQFASGHEQGRAHQQSNKNNTPVRPLDTLTGVSFLATRFRRDIHGSKAARTATIKPLTRRRFGVIRP
jgi:hypothetical protein